MLCEKKNFKSIFFKVCLSDVHAREFDRWIIAYWKMLDYRILLVLNKTLRNITIRPKLYEFLITNEDVLEK